MFHSVKTLIQQIIAGADRCVLHLLSQLQPLIKDIMCVVVVLLWGLLKVFVSPSDSSSVTAYERVLALWLRGADTKTWPLTPTFSCFPLTCEENYKTRRCQPSYSGAGCTAASHSQSLWPFLRSSRRKVNKRLPSTVLQDYVKYSQWAGHGEKGKHNLSQNAQKLRFYICCCFHLCYSVSPHLQAEGSRCQGRRSAPKHQHRKHTQRVFTVSDTRTNRALMLLSCSISSAVCFVKLLSWSVKSWLFCPWIFQDCTATPVSNRSKLEKQRLLIKGALCTF